METVIFVGLLFAAVVAAFWPQIMSWFPPDGGTSEQILEPLDAGERARLAELRRKEGNGAVLTRAELQELNQIQARQDNPEQGDDNRRLQLESRLTEKEQSALLSLQERERVTEKKGPPTVRINLPKRS